MYQIANESATNRRMLFGNAAFNMGISDAIMEKDFWVCFFLDVLFHQSQDATRFCFKGGTSLSKGYHAIRRFSEDIDLILDWRLLGYSRDEPYDKRTNTQQEAFNDVVNGKVPERYARHYYDLYMLSQTPTMDEALADVELLNTVASFNQKFYHSSWAQYDEATLEKITLVPMTETRARLAEDYHRMQDVLFGNKPSFDVIMEGLGKLESEMHRLGAMTTPFPAHEQ